MTSDVDICNLALSNVRAGTINSLNEASVQARHCALKYPILRDRLLTEIPWQFSRVMSALALHSADIFNWAYSYQYPTDCLKIQRLVGESESLANADASVVSRLIDRQILPLKDLRQQIPYEVFNVDGVKLIGSNEVNLRADYASKINDPNLFSVDFIMALSHLMSSELAISLVGGELGRQLRSDSLTIYQEYLSSALANDLNDQYDYPGDSEYVTVRR